jgi:hypothetical protein
VAPCPRVEQSVLWALVGDLQGHAPARPRVGQPQPAGDPQQAAHGFAQIHRCPVGQLQHHGRLPAGAHALEQRLVVVEQQDRGAVGPHVVHQRRHRLRTARADQGGAATPQREAAGALGVGGGGWAPEPRASHEDLPLVR